MQSLIDLIVLVEVDDTVPVRVGLPYDFINHGWVVMHHIADLEAFPPSPGPTRPSTVNCSSCQRVPTSQSMGMPQVGLSAAATTTILIK